MKSTPCPHASLPIHVAPFTGAWIEITCQTHWYGLQKVAPFTGAWIEITAGPTGAYEYWVAPFTGAWIEMDTGYGATISDSGRTLHGCVD